VSLFLFQFVSLGLFFHFLISFIKMLNNIRMILFFICHTFIGETIKRISIIVKKHNHMHDIFNNISTDWLVIYRECSRVSDKNVMFVMCSGVARRVI